MRVPTTIAAIGAAFILMFFMAPSTGRGQPAPCDGHMETWDYPTGMCRPLPMKGMPMRMAMLHGRAFFTGTDGGGPRGRGAFLIPNWLMAEIGGSLGDRQYLAVEFMGTAEKWTFPRAGAPELLQIGEEDASGRPFIDAQHPHSSPVMGLTMSDTISLGRGGDHARIWFAPRGASTDGPVPFMHRPTGTVNPDAPLGHHIGQDAGHISSTVAGASVRLSGSNLELSTFNGREPEPTRVDLPMRRPDSYAARWTQVFSPRLYGMASAAYIRQPEGDEPELDHVWRYSTSVYNDTGLSRGWRLSNALIWGLINGYDHVAALNSWAEEFYLHKNTHGVWGRIEYLQRTAEQLAIADSADPHRVRGIAAATLGYTRRIGAWNEAELAWGGSLTQTFLPREFRASYGGQPLSGKIFLQVGGMKMWNL
jgi:hypothetical protein